MKGFSNQKGFTLIELAIVLVIIGIILGAVLKGQDLIDNARAKSLVSTVNTWKVLTFTYVDRRGRFPGDDTTPYTGIIGDVAAEQTTATSAIQQMENTGFQNLPANPVTLGSYQFWVYFGNDNGNRNVMVICKDAACGTAFTAEEARFMEAIDTSIDGTADAGLGQFRGANAVAALSGSGNTTGGRATAVVNGLTGISETAAGLATAWGTTQHAAVWLFDRPY